VSDLSVGLLVVAAVALVMVGLAFLAIRVRRNGSAGPAVGAVMAAYDEAMHSTAYDTFVELQAQEDRTIPMPAPDHPVTRTRRSVDGVTDEDPVAGRNSR
jgi:hypothetical protein